MVVDWGIVARAIHVLGVIVWIGGVWFVTTVLLPAMSTSRQKNGCASSMRPSIASRPRRG